MKRSTKTKLLGALCLGGAVLLLSGCTANFCSTADQAHIAYPYETGVTVYCDTKEAVPADYKDASWQVYSDNPTLWAYVPVDINGAFTAHKADFLQNTIIKNATSNHYSIPSQGYWKAIDQKMLDTALSLGNISTSTVKAADVNPWTLPDPVQSEAVSNKGALREFGYVKFLGTNSEGKDTLFANWDAWTDEMRMSTDPELGVSNCPSTDFANYYKSQINSKVSGNRSCIATMTGDYGNYGSDSNWAVAMEKKDWGYAWSKGFLEGLIIYPVALMVDTFAYGMDPGLTGFGQIWSIILVTLIVRAVLMALTFKSTLDQQKMQAIQPEMAKLQAKYPNSNTNNAEKQRLAQEQMALYKRHKISMSSTFIGLIFQFPVFISVWGALQGSAVLSSGAFLQLRLSDTIQSALFNSQANWATNYGGPWTALVLFLIMSVTQFLSMMLPQWITKHRNKGMTKLSKNPAQDKNTNTMKYVSYGMLIFTIIMGFMLPSAMGVYWAVGAVISMLQTVVTQSIMARSKKKKKEGK